MSQTQSISDELQKFIDEEFAKLKREIAEAFAVLKQKVASKSSECLFPRRAARTTPCCG